MLQKTAEKERREGRRKKSEVYFAGNENHLLSRFSGAQSRVLKKFHDFKQAVALQLEAYTQFRGGSGRGRLKGGEVPDRVYSARISDDRGRAIDLTITQSYTQPGPRLHYAEAVLKYDPDVSKEDVDIVRNALTNSGLEKKTR